MFREMRRNDKKISEEAAIAILEKGIYGVLSTVGADGYPYGIPVNYLYKKGRIYFHCASVGGHKTENMKYCDKVCFTVTGYAEVLAEHFNMKYESVVVFGRAKEVEDIKQVILEDIIDKYSAEYKKDGFEYIKRAAEKTAVYEIVIEAVSGKAKY